MVRSSIKAHTTAILEGIIAQASSLGPITNPTLKGELRELLIADMFNRFLVPDFGIGTGQIINQKEELSHQIDIIIYDKRILPPFVQYTNLGLYPTEAVIAIIEVKSQLSKKISFVPLKKTVNCYLIFIQGKLAFTKISIDFNLLHQ